MSKTLGVVYCKAVLGLHVFTGCDTVSAFRGKGKSKALLLLKEDKQYIDLFATLGDDFNVPIATLSGLEKFVCHLYGQKPA